MEGRRTVRAFGSDPVPRAAIEDAIRAAGTAPSGAHKEPWTFVVVEDASIRRRIREAATKGKHYYVNESVGISVGFFLAAIRHAGFAALTHTPSPMRFLLEILGRPQNERAYVVIPVGYPAEGAMVADLRRKRLDEISVWL